MMMFIGTETLVTDKNAAHLQGYMVPGAACLRLMLAATAGAHKDCHRDLVRCGGVHVLTWLLTLESAPAVRVQVPCTGLGFRV